MKINREYALRQVAGVWMLIPTGQTLKVFRGILKLNEVGAFLWRGLEEGKTVEELTKSLVDTYGITSERASTDISEFIAKLRNNGCVEN